MSREDLLDFIVLFYSPDGVNSPIYDALADIYRKNPEAGMTCLDKIQAIPSLHYHNSKSVKFYKHAGVTFHELKVKFKGNEFRFFFIIEKPNMIVFYGFTKKTQKTEKKDKAKGMVYLKDYLEYKTTVKPKFKK